MLCYQRQEKKTLEHGLAMKKASIEKTTDEKIKENDT